MNSVEIKKRFDNNVDYYKYVIKAITSQASADKMPTETEAILLAHALDIGHEYPFFGQARKELMSRMNIKDQTLSMHKKHVIDKQLVTKEGKLSAKIAFIKFANEGLSLTINFFI